MNPIRNDIVLPGDKSISHRALMFAALAEGTSVINNLSTGEDVKSTQKCLIDCGVQIKKNNSSVSVIGGKLRKPDKVLNCRNSGTTLRLMMGLLASRGLSAKFEGDTSLSNRPMKRVIEPLTQMGAKFISNNGYLPISMKVSDINSIKYEMPIASAQVKSSILISGLNAFGKTVVVEKIKTRDHTEIMLNALGADIVNNSNQISINKLKSNFKAFNITIPGDPSSAAFFAALAALIPNSILKIKNLLANPTRIGFFSILEKMGVNIEWQNLRNSFGEKIGDVNIVSQPLSGININKEDIPSIIDEIPIIAILAAYADSPTIISGAEELRVKESDRINAICLNLNNMGCNIIEKKDGFIINPDNKLHNTSISSYGDHRIAMAFTIAGYLTSAYNEIDDNNCINISFPEFHSVLNKIVK